MKNTTVIIAVYITATLTAIIYSQPCYATAPTQEENHLIDACQQGSKQACHDLIRLYRKQIISPRCAPLMLDLCRKDYFEACMVLYFVHTKVDVVANLKYSGVQCDRQLDLPKANQYIEETCEKEYPPACNQISSNYVKGQGGYPKNAGKGFEYYKQTCLSGFGSACYTLGLDYWEGSNFPWGQIKIDHKVSFDYFSEGCQKNHVPSCMFVAGMYMKGAGTAQNYNDALRVYSKICDHHNHRHTAKACYRVGVIYQKHLKIRSKSNQYFEKSCQKGFSKGCIDEMKQD